MGVGVLVSAYAGPAGSAWYSAYTTHLNGGSFSNAAMAGGITLGTSLAFKGVDSLAGSDPVHGILGHGLVGGTSAELQGGKFVNGFAMAAGTRTLKIGWQAAKVWTNTHTTPLNTTDCGMGPCTDGTKPILGGKLARGNKILEWIANFGQGPEYIKGTSMRGNHFYSGVPLFDSLVQATSKVHDWIVGWALGRYTAGGYYIPFGSVGAEAAFNVFGNWGTMLPAAAYTAGALASGHPVVVDAARRIK